VAGRHAGDDLHCRAAVYDTAVARLFASGVTWANLDNFSIIVLKTGWVVPGVFEHNRFPVDVCAPLWTLPIEVRCYLIVMVTGMLGCCPARAAWRWRRRSGAPRSFCACICRICRSACVISAKRPAAIRSGRNRFHAWDAAVWLARKDRD